MTRTLPRQLAEAQRMRETAFDRFIYAKPGSDDYRFWLNALDDCDVLIESLQLKLHRAECRASGKRHLYAVSSRQDRPGRAIGEGEAREPQRRRERVW